MPLREPARAWNGRAALRAGGLALAGCCLLACVAGRETPPPTLDHQCHLFGYAFAAGSGSAMVLADLCSGLYAKTIQEPLAGKTNGATIRETPSRDGWGFGYFLSPPLPAIERPMLIKSGAAASDDSARWFSTQDELEQFVLAAEGVILGHVRLSSYGPDEGALPNPHPFADSLGGRWWLFAHNGHMRPDTLLPWIPEGFLARHPLDYASIPVDSEVLFRYCQFEIERLGSVRAGLLHALHRVKGYDDFVFNICLTDGDTLWAAHSHDSREFYFSAAEDSTAWWASTVSGEGNPAQIPDHHLYWFSGAGMGSQGYE